MTLTDIITRYLTMFSANRDSQQEKARGGQYFAGFYAIG